MIKTLAYDAGSGELRLRYHDLWRGNHEVTEFRVTDMRGGAPLRGEQWASMDGRAVGGLVPDLYLKPREPFRATDRAPRVWYEESPVAPTVKTPCPKSANARRKCALCAETGEAGK